MNYMTLFIRFKANAENRTKDFTQLFFNKQN